MRVLLSKRLVRVGMRVHDKSRGLPVITEVDGKGFATRWGYGFWPKIGRVKIWSDDD